jgi:UDP-N-acetylglucosamine--N-acetylmuramyl-(pentapeptide) pyrophosphoryl-undecaprenol N-acetylglucosamine transferase
MAEQALRLMIGGGGTGGHTQPAVAVLRALRQRVPVEALWIGSHSGLERQVASEAGVPFRAVSTGKLRRYPSARTLVDAIRVPLGILQAYRHVRAFHPHVIFGTGGFVSVPTVIAGFWGRCPTLIHEQTATAGLATRINARFADVIALSYATSERALRRRRGRLVVTGNPVRPELFEGQAARAYQGFGLTPDMPLIYITGGALGAHAINLVVERALPLLLERTQVVHQCGPASMNGDYPRLLDRRASLPAELAARYAVREFLGEELADVYAAAWLVVGRAGAGTIAELAALGKPSVLIPLPGAGGDEQTLNARILSDTGAAVLLPQRELSEARLLEVVSEILGDEGRRRQMAEAARRQARLDAADRLADLILELAHRPVPERTLAR